MKNSGVKIVMLGAVVLIILFIGGVRFYFNGLTEEFSDSVDQKERALNEQFEARLAGIKDSLVKVGSPASAEFKILSNSINRYSEVDTSLSFLYLEERISYNRPIAGVLECLLQCADVKTSNNLERLKIENLESALKDQYYSIYSDAIAIVGYEKLTKGETCCLDCPKEVERVQSIAFKAEYWNEFKSFLKQFERDKKKDESSYGNAINKVDSDFKNVIRKTGGNLPTNQIEGYIDFEESTKTFQGALLGNLVYPSRSARINQIEVDSRIDNLWKKYYANNSLRTGAMPYASCFGSRNYCDDWSSSSVKIINGGQDVIASIKTSSGKVIRHAYINGSGTFTFKIPDGTYSVHFYSGTGWNPNKILTTSSRCGSLRGAFVSNTNVTKDSYLSLHSQSMEYTLTPVRNGNFSPSSSSVKDAF